MRARLEGALLKAMDQALAEPMRWGADDCALFCANVIRDALGYDPAESLRGRYATRAEAQALLAPLGLAFVLKNAAARFGWRRVAPADARCGDLGLSLMRHGERSLPVTLIGRAPGWFVARGEHGFAAVRAQFVRLAWAVV